MDKDAAVKKFLKDFMGSQDVSLFVRIGEISAFSSVANGAVLFREGDEAKDIYYLVSGSLKLFRLSEDGRESVIKFVRPGELFAEISADGGRKYPVNAEVLKKSELLKIPAVNMKKICSEYPDFTMRLFGVMVSRMKYLVDAFDGMVSKDVRGRLLRYLEKAAGHGGSPFELPVAKGELALLLGTTPETLSRLFTKLEGEGLIKRVGRGTIYLKKND